MEQGRRAHRPELTACAAFTRRRILLQCKAFGGMSHTDSALSTRTSPAFREQITSRRWGRRRVTYAARRDRALPALAEGAAEDELLGDVAELHVRVLAHTNKDGKSLIWGDLVTLHEDALRLPDDLAGLDPVGE